MSFDEHVFHFLVVTLPEGKRSLMKLSQRMVKNFCGMLSMAGNLDFPQLSEVDDTGIQVSVHTSTEIGQPHGTIVSVATSLWFPLSTQAILNFFKDEKTRVQVYIYLDLSVIKC